MGRLVLSISGLLAVFAAASAWNDFERRRDTAIQKELAKIQAVARTLSLAFDEQEALSKAVDLPARDQIRGWDELPAGLARLRHIMCTAAERNGIESPIRVLVLRRPFREAVRRMPDHVHRNAMEGLLSTAQEPCWRHTHEYRPEMRTAVLGGRPSSSGVYHDERGAWISAYSPLSVEIGGMSALIEVDTPMDAMLARVDGEYLVAVKTTILVFVGTLLGIVLIALRADRTLWTITAAAERFGAGDLGTPIPIGGTTETHHLGETLEQARIRTGRWSERNRRLVHRLREALDGARAASREKSEFIANMSHEIRTPLSGVLGMAQLLEGTELDPQQREYVKTITRSGTALLTILSDVIDLARLDRKELRLELREFSIRDVVDDVVAVNSPAARQKEIRLLGRVDADVPERCFGDSARLRQVLMHLVDNSLKFTERGTVRVCVEQEVSSKTDEDAIRFEVRDTGIGFSAGAGQRVLAPFAPGDARVARRHGGCGLGLVLARRLVELMKGELDLESEQDVGTVVWFTMPVRVEETVAPIE